MRSLFWRIFASFWLAIALVAGLSMLLGRALNQDAWVIGHHPAVSELAELWTQLYEQEGAQTAQNFLEKRKKRYRVDTQVLDDSGRSLVYGTFPPRAAAADQPPLLRQQGGNAAVGQAAANLRFLPGQYLHSIKAHGAACAFLSR